jgi:hypothetical protein
MLKANKVKSTCLSIIAAIIFALAPVSGVYADGPQIRIEPGLLTIWTVPFLGGDGTYRAVVYDEDPPYVLNGAVFDASAWGYCAVTGLDALPFTYQITTPDGQGAVGLGVIAFADFGAEWPGYGYFLHQGDFYIYAVDPEGNLSAGYAPVFVIG